MKYILSMAFKNTKRNKRRSFLAVISVGLSLLFIVFMQGFVGGFLGSMIKNTTRNETGHIRITTQEFKEKSKFMPVNENLSDPNKIISTIMADEDIAEEIDIITSRTNFGVLLSNDGNNKTAMALSGDPETEKILTRLNRSILEGGRYIENNKEMIIGSELAKTLKHKLGDEVKVMTQGSDYALHLKKFKIVGIFKTNLNMMDESIFQIRLDDAQHLLRMDDDVQQIIIMLKDYARSEEMAKLIAAKLNDKNLAVNPWSEISTSYEYIQMAAGVYEWMYIIIALLGAFIIGNIMMMVVLERRHEIGILKSMGLKSRQILALFLTERMILGLVGSVVGSLIAVGLISIININGMDFSQMIKGVKGFPMDNILFLKISTYSVLRSIFLGTIISSLVSILPSRKAAKMNVVDSIKSI